MQYLGVDLPALKTKGAVHTAREITQQPDLWQKVWEVMSQNRQGLQRFLELALSDTKRIVITGAGTSAFIGLSLSGIIQRMTGVVTNAIATTDLVSHPKDYFMADVPTLLISFARSGNSPESVAAISLAQEICEKCYHLVITCNPDGQLARYGQEGGRFVLALPAEANDQDRKSVV